MVWYIVSGRLVCVLVQTAVFVPDRDRNTQRTWSTRFKKVNERKITFLWQKQGKHFWLDIKKLLANVL